MIEGSDEYAKITNKTSKLASELKYLVEPFKSEMESCGLLFEEDGTMKIDESLALRRLTMEVCRSFLHQIRIYQNACSVKARV